MLKKPRRHRIGIFTDAVQCHFQERAVGIPSGLGVLTAKRFESVNDTKLSLATNKPPIELVREL